MTEAVILNLKKIRPDKLKRLRAFLHPGYSPLFDPPDLLDPENSNLIVAACYNKQTLVGLGIALRMPEFSITEIKSLQTLPEYRLKNPIYLIVKAIENESKKIGDQMMLAMYPNEPPYLDEWEKPLIKLEWEGKRRAVLECFFADATKFNPPWFSKAYKFSSDYEIFLWKDLKPEDKESIKTSWSRHAIPEAAYPFQGTGEFEPQTSVGLRHKGHVVSWVVNRLIKGDSGPDTLCYFCMYAEYDLQSTGYPVQLLIESIKLHQQSTIKQGLLRVNTIYAHSRWIKFVQKRLAPYSDKTTEYCQAWHTIQ